MKKSGYFFAPYNLKEGENMARDMGRSDVKPQDLKKKETNSAGKSCDPDCCDCCDGSNVISPKTLLGETQEKHPCNKSSCAACGEDCEEF